MLKKPVVGVAVVLLLLGQRAGAQVDNPLVGTWERVSATNADGTPDTHPPAFVVFTANGQYVEIAIPQGRPKLAKALEEMTREELLARFVDVQARRSEYGIRGNELVRKDVTNVNPNREGFEQVVNFRIEADS